MSVHLTQQGVGRVNPAEGTVLALIWGQNLIQVQASSWLSSLLLPLCALFWKKLGSLATLGVAAAQIANPRGKCHCWLIGLLVRWGKGRAKREQVEARGVGAG